MGGVHKRPEKKDVSTSFKTWIPESMLIPLHVDQSSLSPVAVSDLDTHVLTLQRLFLMYEIDAATLAFLIQTRVKPEQSSSAMLKVVGAFVTAISNAADGETTKLLLHRYICVFSHFPPLMAEYAFGPLRHALDQDIAERTAASDKPMVSKT